MSIDGKWIRKNEVREFREGPFVEDNITVLRKKVREKFYEASSLFDEFKFFFQKDNFDELFPEDSFEMTSLDLYSSLYKDYCSFDLNDANSMRWSIDGFDKLIPMVRQIENKMKVKFYPGINSRDNDKTWRAQTQYRMDKLKFSMDQAVIKANNINVDDSSTIRRPR